MLGIGWPMQAETSCLLPAYVYLFVLLDLFIPVSQNCHRIQLIYDFPQPNISTNSYVVDSHRKWSDDFHVIRSFQVGDWIERGTKSATAGQMINAYKQLINMVRSGLVKAGTRSPEFSERIAHLDECKRGASALARDFKSLRWGSSHYTPFASFLGVKRPFSRGCGRR